MSELKLSKNGFQKVKAQRLIDKFYEEVKTMNKLKIKVISETALLSMAGCGKNNFNFCGARICDGGRRAG